jgi:membrane protein implicated in regulation of membrane protease activity
MQRMVIDQSKLSSLIEALFNTFIGFGIALGSQLIIFPMVGLHDVPLSTNIEITMWFTLVSVVRSYFVRRLFNRQLHKAARSLARKIV